MIEKLQRARTRRHFVDPSSLRGPGPRRSASNVEPLRVVISTGAGRRAWLGHCCGVVTHAGEWDAGDLFERFTERARQVVVLAQEESRSLKHNYIGTEHLLLGLLREREGAAAHVLHSVGVTIDGVREQVIEIVGCGEEPTAGQIPFTPRAKKVLELSLRESLNLGHTDIGTEHLLLGLTRENDGVATRILLHFDADADTIRRTTTARRSLAPGGDGRLRSNLAPPAAPGTRSIRLGCPGSVASWVT